MIGWPSLSLLVAGTSWWAAGGQPVEPAWAFEVDVAIAGFTLINYMVPPERMALALPPGWTPVTTLVDGRETAWFSLFLGRACLPWAPELAVEQLNYRTYVEGPEGRAIYVFRSVVGDRGARPLDALLDQAAYACLLYPASFRPFHLAIAGEREHPWRIQASVDEGSELYADLRVGQQDPPEDAVDFLGNVPHGYFELEDGRCRHLLAPHPPLQPRSAVAYDLRAPLAVEAGWLTLEESAHPTSIFVQGWAPFPTVTGIGPAVPAAGPPSERRRGWKPRRPTCTV